MARMAELQPVAFSPFPRIRSTASFSSSCDGDSVRSHLKLYLYHSRVEGETFESNWRSRMNSENPISAFSKASTQIWRKTAQLADSKGTWLSLVEHSLGVRGVGSSNLPVPTKTSLQPKQILRKACPGFRLQASASLTPAKRLKLKSARPTRCSRTRSCQ